MIDPREHPLNKLACEFLPSGWQDNRTLPVLNLMLWGLLEARPDLVLLAPPPDADDLQAALMSLMMDHPQATLDYLLGKTENVNDELPLVRNLERATDPAQAASRLLQSLQSLQSFHSNN